MKAKKVIQLLVMSLLAIWCVKNLSDNHLVAQQDAEQSSMATEIVSPVVTDDDGEYGITQGIDGHCYCDKNGNGQNDCENYHRSKLECKTNNGTWISTGHTGIDLSQSGSADKNDPVLAIADGVVKDTQYTSGWGQKVRIEHQVLNFDGTYFKGYTRYGHGYVDSQGKSSLIVANGDYVSAGQRIMGIGTTGNSTGEHLHYEWQWFYEGSNGYYTGTDKWEKLTRYEDPERLREVYTRDGAYYPVGFMIDPATREIRWDTYQVQGRDCTLLFRLAYLVDFHLLKYG